MKINDYVSNLCYSLCRGITLSLNIYRLHIIDVFSFVSHILFVIVSDIRLVDFVNIYSECELVESVM